MRFSEGKAPRKSWRSESQSESKGPRCYGPCPHVPVGLPRGEVTERSESKGPSPLPHVAGVCFTRLHRGPSVAEVTPLSAPISVLIDRNDTITVWFFVLVFS